MVGPARLDARPSRIKRCQAVEQLSDCCYTNPKRQRGMTASLADASGLCAPPVWERLYANWAYQESKHSLPVRNQTPIRRFAPDIGTLAGMVWAGGIVVVWSLPGVG